MLVRNFGKCSLISNNRYIRVELQDGCRNFRCNRSKECFCYDVCLVFSAYNEENLFGTHDRTDSHGVCLSRNVISRSKEAFVCLDGAFLKVYTVCCLWKIFCRLVKTNMSIVSKTEELEIYTPERCNYFLVMCAFCLAVFFCAVRNIGIGRIDIDMIKQVLVHEIVVALIVVSCQTFILVQICCFHL